MSQGLGDVEDERRPAFARPRGGIFDDNIAAIRAPGMEWSRPSRGGPLLVSRLSAQPLLPLGIWETECNLMYLRTRAVVRETSVCGFPGGRLFWTSHDA